MASIAKVRTCLWFEKDALAAARFYVSLFPDSYIVDEQRFEHLVTGEPDGVQVVSFSLAGTPFEILQAGTHQQFNDMMSIAVLTDDQAETDRLWSALTAEGGQEVQCGWLKDRWGVPWQIVPRRFAQLLESGDRAKIGAMMKAMFGMKKLDEQALAAAFAAG